MKIPVALLRLMAVAAAAVALFVTSGRAQEPSDVGSPAGEEKPNVLFISIDDLNDWIEPLGGYPRAVTPNLDRLAKRSMNFTRAYCSSPVCNPSRASLMTGRRPSSIGVYDNPDPWRAALPNAVTIPQHFRASGYVAKGRGKIYHGQWPDKTPGAWDVYIPKLPDPVPELTEEEKKLEEKVGKLFSKGLPVGDEAMDDFHAASWVAEQLGQEFESPFFLGCGIYRPHLRWHVPQRYFDLYPLDEITLPKVLDTDLDDVPPVGRKLAKPERDHARVVEHDYWREAVQGYLASVSFADAQVGRILDVLEKSPYADNTLVVLWSDHGWHLGEKTHWRKFALWEEATRVVLMISRPGGGQEGVSCARTVSLLDLYPTLVDLCGLASPEVPGGLEGQSLRPLLDDPAAEWDRPVLTTFHRNQHAVRSERWRYIRYEDGTEELYDHEQDPLEWKNLAGSEEHQAVIDEHRKRLPKKNQPVVSNVSKAERRRLGGFGSGFIGTTRAATVEQDRLRAEAAAAAAGRAAQDR